MSEFEGATGIASHKHAFDRDNVRSKLLNNVAYRIEYFLQALRERAIRGFDRAAGDIGRLITLKIEYAETRKSGSGIDSEYAPFVVC